MYFTLFKFLFIFIYVFFSSVCLRAEPGDSCGDGAAGRAGAGGAIRARPEPQRAGHPPTIRPHGPRVGGQLPPHQVAASKGQYIRKKKYFSLSSLH